MLLTKNLFRNIHQKKIVSLLFFIVSFYYYYFIFSQSTLWDGDYYNKGNYSLYSFSIYFGSYSGVYVRIIQGLSLGSSVWLLFKIYYYFISNLANIFIRISFFQKKIFTNFYWKYMLTFIFVFFTIYNLGNWLIGYSETTESICKERFFTLLVFYLFLTYSITNYKFLYTLLLFFSIGFSIAFSSLNVIVIFFALFIWFSKKIKKESIFFVSYLFFVLIMLFGERTLSYGAVYIVIPFSTYNISSKWIFYIVNIGLTPYKTEHFSNLLLSSLGFFRYFLPK